MRHTKDDMDRTPLTLQFDEYLQGCVREASQEVIERIVAAKLAPLLARIEQLENQRLALQANGPEANRKALREAAFAPSGGPAAANVNKSTDPYHAEAGDELNKRVHITVMRQRPNSPPYPAYSTDLNEARKVLAELKTRYRISVIWGRTSIVGRTWFARIANAGDERMEVLGETLPLAICRLGLVQVAREGLKDLCGPGRSSGLPRSPLMPGHPARV